MKSNHIVKFVSIVGENKVKHVLNNIIKNGKKGAFKFELSTNPVNRYLMSVTNMNSHILTFRAGTSRNQIDEFYFIATACLLDYLKDEIKRNPSYEKEVVAGIMGKDMGTFYSSYCELLVAGYIKFLGGEIRLNSSADSGRPDIQEIGEEDMAHECKLFPDPEFEFASKINHVAELMATSLSKYSDAMLTVMVRDNKRFLKQMPDLIKEFYEKGVSHSEVMSIINFPRLANDTRPSAKNFHTNFELIFQFTGDYGPVVEKYEASLLKSIKQANQSGNEHLTTWSYFYSNNNINMTMRLLTQVTDTIMSHTSKGYGLVYVALNPFVDENTRNLSLNFGVNAFNYSGKLDINMGSFERFVHEKVFIQTIPIP